MPTALVRDKMRGSKTVVAATKPLSDKTIPD
jgi:hypothetical protein